MVSIWTVYGNPSDYPGKFVARKFIGETMTNEMLVFDDLERLRDVMQFEFGLVKLMRHPTDDPVILETWL